MTTLSRWELKDGPTSQSLQHDGIDAVASESEAKLPALNRGCSHQCLDIGSSGQPQRGKVGRA